MNVSEMIFFIFTGNLSIVFYINYATRERVIKSRVLALVHPAKTQLRM
ncbi:MAG: hypothetical protein RI947_491 [Candidatus Parcubacteria bacterium]|jgi:hypothetical protein